MRRYIPPQWLSAALQTLEHEATVRLYYFGGMIRDQLQGRIARDYDILVFGDFEKLTRISGSQMPALLSAGRILHRDNHNVLIEKSSPEKCTLDFINANDFLLRYSREFKCILPTEASEEELVRYAVEFCDFTSNACAVSVRAPHLQISHQSWEIDCTSKSLELTSPAVLSVPHWPGIKALYLAAETGSSIAPLLADTLRAYAKEGLWLKLPPDLLYRQMVRLFASADPIRSAELLRDSGLLSAMFQRDDVPARTLTQLKMLEGDPALPRLGAEGYAPWYVSTFLCGSGLHNRELPILTAVRPEHAQSLKALSGALPGILKSAFPLETE